MVYLNVGTELWYASTSAVPAPPVPGLLPPPICAEGSATLHVMGATAGQKYRWYASATSSAVLKQSADASDYSFTTPVITASQEYYVSILNEDESLESTRVAINVAVVPLSVVTINGKNSVNPSETVGYTAAHNGSTDNNILMFRTL